MKKSTIGDFDLSDSLHQFDLDNLQSLFGPWRGRPSAASKFPAK